MAIDDYPYSFNPILAVDRSTLQVAKSATVRLRAEPSGAPLPLADLDGTPLGTEIVTTPDGVIPGHRTTAAQPFIDAGSGIMLRETATELHNALSQATAAQVAAEGARAAAEAALEAVSDGDRANASDIAVRAAAGARRALDFIDAQLEPRLSNPTTDEGRISTVVNYPANYEGPVHGTFSMPNPAPEARQRCRIFVADPGRLDGQSLPDEYRGMVFGQFDASGLADPDPEHYRLMAMKEVDALYDVGVEAGIGPGGNFALDFSLAQTWQKGRWRIKAYKTTDGAARAPVGAVWPSLPSYDDTAVRVYSVTDNFYQVGDDLPATIDGRFNTLYSLPGRKRAALVKVSTGDVLADHVPLLGLPRSYNVEDGQPGAGTGFESSSYAYDVGVALCAAIAGGRRELADRLVSGLLTLQQQTGPQAGGWRFSGHQLWPQVGDEAFRVGAHAWALYGLLRYMEAYPLDERHDYRGAALAGFAYLESVRQTSGPQSGLYRGGSGLYTPTEGGQTFQQDYDITWCSTEHNIDIWFTLTLGATVLGDTTLTTRASALRTAMLSKLWSSDLNRLLQGMKEDGTEDREDPLDVHSWGAIWLHAVGYPERARDTLSDEQLAPFLYSRTSSNGNVVSGYSIYSNDTDNVWSEGTYGVAYALRVLGEPVRWAQVMAGMMPGEEVDGSYRYVTDSDPVHGVNPYRCVIGPAWMVCAVAGGLWLTP